MFYLLTFTLILPLLKLMLIRQNCLINIFILFLLAVTSQCLTQWICLFLTTYIFSISFTIQEVFDALTILNPHKASGIDNIPTTVLKNCAHALAQPIHYLFTTSINRGTIPSEWKTHKITPVHKSGDKTLVTNYCPISLLWSKVLERLICDKIIDLVACSLTLLQFGFQRGSSTLQQLLVYFH